MDKKQYTTNDILANANRNNLFLLKEKENLKKAIKLPAPPPPPTVLN